MVSKKHQETWMFFKLKFQRKNVTNFVAMSISNGHKSKRNSNFVLALSLSY